MEKILTSLEPKTPSNPAEDLRKIKSQLEAVFNCIADPLNIQDPSLNVLMCNPARAALYNKSVQDIVGKKCYEAFQNRTESCLSCAVIDAFQTGKPSYRLRYREGNERAASWAEIFAFPIHNDQGEVVQVVEFARDITQRKHAEDEIRKLYAELEQKVDERTKELQKIQEEMVHKEKLAVIGQLIGSVGHEFRSSLTILSGILYLLKNRGGSEDIEEFIDTLEEEIHKMSKFVEDLLDFSRNTAPTFQPVDLERVIQKLLQKIDVPSQIQVFIDMRNPAAPTESLSKAYVDPDHAEQIFHNIISNAIQAMPTGGTLRIRGTQEGPKIVVSFTDSGVGISPINIRKIFTPLFTTKAKGTGLGLSIVNMLIKKNKGAIRVESVPTQGSTFTLYFPATPEPEKEMG
jgi:PAS domain S-box-containing protein